MPIAYISFIHSEYKGKQNKTKQKKIVKRPLFTLTQICSVVHTPCFLSPAFLWCRSRAMSRRAAGEDCLCSSQENEAGEETE